MKWYNDPLEAIDRWELLQTIFLVHNNGERFMGSFVIATWRSFMEPISLDADNQLNVMLGKSGLWRILVF